MPHYIDIHELPGITPEQLAGAHAADVRTQEKEGHAEKVGTARRLQAEVGVRDREKGRVEIVRLVDPEKKAPAPAPAEAWFVADGAHGLQDGDAVKVEEPEAGKEE